MLMVKKKKKVSGPKTKSRLKKKALRPKAKTAKGRKKAVKVSGKTKKALEIGLEKVGEVTHYFPHVNAAAIKILKDGIKVGDNVYIKGHTTDFKEKINSIQLDHAPIQEGKKGQEIGLLVKSRVRIGDSVYKL
jgi:putative protease